MLTKDVVFKWARLLIIPLVVILAACDGLDTASSPTDTPIVVTDPVPTATQPPLPTATMQQMAEGQIFLETMNVVILESFPVQVQVTVNGNLSDGCTTLAETTVERTGSTFTINMTAVRDDSAVCTQALVPFAETIALDVQGLPAGSYVVNAGELSESFTLDVDNGPVAIPDLGAASLSVSQNSAEIGDAVTLTGSGFPANVPVEIGFGRLNSEYDIIADTQSGEDGSFTIEVIIPDFASPQDEWVFVADVVNGKVIADPILILADSETGGLPEDGEVNVPVNGQFTRTTMYLVAIGDAGQSGPLIGCDDTVVPVIIDIEPTVAPLTAAINRLLSLEDEFYGQSGLYNSLHQSDLTLDGINIVQGAATISLSGDLVLSGVCDNPRVLAQIEYTALQYSTVDSVIILLNGQSLESQLSGQ